MDPDSLMVFIIMWGVPSIMVIREYVKMDSNDIKEGKSDLLSRRFMLTGGLVMIGGFLTNLGLITTSIIKVCVIVILIIGGIFSILNKWKQSKIKSIIILIISFKNGV
ncbi:hypothetical protein [Bacillus sp. JCM 19034]|uniref:hypothetical protein n=1 Tax=Bacillus sp. JCM 19034 TaxID=1481928 RepID=UPI0007825825|nr:hypothetical protein [Bacillus sp. JCM 19034]